MGSRKAKRVKANSGSTKATAVSRLRRALRARLTRRGRPSAVVRTDWLATTTLIVRHPSREKWAGHRPAPIRHSLLSQPGAEALVQFILVIGPELHVLRKRRLKVVRRGRPVWPHVDTGLPMLADQRDRRIAGGTVGDPARLSR